LDDECSIVDAIDAANTDSVVGGCVAGSGSDVLILSDNIVLFDTDNDTDGPNGTPVITSEIEVDGAGFQLIRAGVDDFRFFRVAPEGTLKVTDLTLVGGGDISDGSAVSNAGSIVCHRVGFVGSRAAPALYNTGSAVLFDGEWVGNNGGEFLGDGTGAAVRSEGDLLIVGGSLRANKAADGGAIFNTGTATIIDAEIQGNYASFDGAGVYNGSKGTMVILRSDIAENAGGEAGSGIYNAGDLTVEDSWIRKNVLNSSLGSGNGGGIRSSGDLTVRRSTISENEAYTGGGLYLAGTVLIERSTISRNVASSNGGAIINFADLALSAVSFFGNRVEPPGGVSGLWFDDFDTGAVTMERTIFGGHEHESCGGTGVILDQGGNLDDDQTCGPDVGALDGLDPELLDHGGPTPTHALLPGSSAIDEVECGFDTDQRGYLRTDLSCDSGAYEFEAGPLVVDVFGECPGEVSIDVSGGVPSGQADLVWATRAGQTSIPVGPCAGLELSLADPRLIDTLTLDESGSASFIRGLSPSECGSLFRAIDRSTCALSDVVGP